MTAIKLAYKAGYRPMPEGGVSGGGGQVRLGTHTYTHTVLCPELLLSGLCGGGRAAGGRGGSFYIINER